MASHTGIGSPPTSITAATTWHSFVDQLRLHSDRGIGYIVALPALPGADARAVGRYDWRDESWTQYGFTPAQGNVQSEAALYGEDVGFRAHILALEAWAQPLYDTHKALMLRVYRVKGEGIWFSTTIRRPFSPPPVPVPASIGDTVATSDDDTDAPHGHEPPRAPAPAPAQGAPPPGFARPSVKDLLRLDPDPDSDPESDADSGDEDEADSDTADAVDAATLRAVERRLQALERTNNPGKRKPKRIGAAAVAPSAGVQPLRRVLNGLAVSPVQGNIALTPPLDLDAAAEVGLAGIVESAQGIATLQLVQLTRVATAQFAESTGLALEVYHGLVERLAEQNATLFRNNAALVDAILDDRLNRAAQADVASNNADKVAVAGRAAETLIREGRQYMESKQALDALDALPEDKRAAVLARHIQAKARAMGVDSAEAPADAPAPTPAEAPADALNHDEATLAADEAALVQAEVQAATAEAVQADKALAELLRAKHVQEALHDPALQKALADPEQVSKLRAFLALGIGGG